MIVLITGASGFVGRHVAAALRRVFGADATLAPTARRACHIPGVGDVAALDVTDAEAVAATVRRVRPTHVIHLAGMAAVPASSADPDRAWRLHLHGALAMGRAIRDHAPECWLLHVASGQIYGAVAREGRPLTEADRLAPTNEYEATKAAADLALGAMAAKGLRCIRLRPFNHTGPGQTEDFVVPSFAGQIARIEAGIQRPVLKVGNLEMERDFLDVRDVAAAYAAAARRADRLEPGLILNIASGVPRRIRAVLDQLRAMSTVSIAVEPDPARMRPSETPCFVGDAGLAHRVLDWQPEVAFERTLSDVLDDCRSRTAAVA